MNLTSNYHDAEINRSSFTMFPLSDYEGTLKQAGGYNSGITACAYGITILWLKCVTRL